MLNTAIVASGHGNENLAHHMTGLLYKRYILSDEGKPQFHRVRDIHGDQPKKIEALRPGTANINLQGFVFAVPGLFGCGEYTALLRCKGQTQANNQEGISPPAMRRLSWRHSSTRSTSRRSPSRKTRENIMATNCDTLSVVNINGGLCSESHGVAQRLPFTFRRRV